MLRVRWALPVWLLASAAALEALLLGLERLRAPRALAQAIAIAVVASIAWVDWAPRQMWPVVEASHQQMQRFCAAAARELTPEARPAAMLGWHYSVYLGRPVWSLMFEQQRHGPESLPALFARDRIDTVLLSELMPAPPAVEEQLAPLTATRRDVELGTVVRLK